jgi:hypothetical protein
MRALSGSTFDFATLQGTSADQCATPPRDLGVHPGRHKLIVVLYLVSAPVATIGWLAGLWWTAIKVVGYVLL